MESTSPMECATSALIVVLYPVRLNAERSKPCQGEEDVTGKMQHSGGTGNEPKDT
jgi:hypothetical protein